MNLNAKKNAAYNRIRKMADEARALGTAGVDAAVDKCLRFLDKVGREKLTPSKKTGNALSTHHVKGSRKGWTITEAAYALAGNFLGAEEARKRVEKVDGKWTFKHGMNRKGKGAGKAGGHIEWSFFNGVPLFALNQMRKYFKLEVVKRLGGS